MWAAPLFCVASCLEPRVPPKNPGGIMGAPPDITQWALFESESDRTTF